MSFISTGVEYALHCLLYLSKPHPGTTEANVRDLAKLQGVPAEYLAKVFTKLHKPGLVIATEGAKGGFTLGRPPEQITVHDVVLAIDGQKSLFECREIRARNDIFCSETPPDWATSGVCSIHAVMIEAEQQMRQSLAKTTLFDLAQQVVTKAPPVYGTQIIKWFDERPSARRTDKA